MKFIDDKFFSLFCNGHTNKYNAVQTILHTSVQTITELNGQVFESVKAADIESLLCTVR